MQGVSKLNGALLEVFEVFLGANDHLVYEKPYPSVPLDYVLQAALKDQYLITRAKGERTLRAVRLCNYSEYYDPDKNTCTPCQ